MGRATMVTVTALLASLSHAVAAFNPLGRHHQASNSSANCSETSLADLALGKVLQDAAPIFGIYQNDQSSTATWMKAYDDDTPIVHMNLPGTHDAATWNYSVATQMSISHVTQLVDVPEYNPEVYRCQDMSMTTMLNAGIRVFDLRYAYDVTNTSLVFWHGLGGLMSETATLDDVLFGFYRWLDQHPSEAIFLSFQYESGTSPGSSNDVGVQMMLYDALTSPAAKKYILQTKDNLGTLGQARGKATLFKRFDLARLPKSYRDALPGIEFTPSKWTDNSANITLQYSSNGTAYIEDYYSPGNPFNSTAAYNIQTKLNATEAALTRAANTHPDSLFWSFTSSTKILNNPPGTPRLQAVGDDSTLGVNQQLVPFLEGMKGKRLGIVMFDFFEQPSELLPLFLSLLPPSSTDT